jgi:hypothetical protein
MTVLGWAGRPVSTNSLAISTTSLDQPANSSPGEIYPSILDAPTAGCWHVTAEWNNNRATSTCYTG